MRWEAFTSLTSLAPLFISAPGKQIRLRTDDVDSTDSINTDLLSDRRKIITWKVKVHASVALFLKWS